VRILIDYRAALRIRSGVGEYVHQLITALALRESAAPSDDPLHLTVFSSSWKDRLTRPPEWNAANVGRVIDLVDRRVPVAALNWSWHRLGWPPAEMLTGGRFDVTHSLHPLVLPSRHAASVITIHDLAFLTHPEHTRAEIRRDYPHLAKTHAGQADQIVVPSHFTAREVTARFDIPPERISVCSPGAPAWQPRVADRVVRHEGYLLFFGTLEPRKNVGTLLDAYERLLETRRAAGRATPELVLAGRLTPDADAWVARIKRAPLVGHVRMTGYVDPARRQALYDGAYVLVQPSFEEGFGMPVLEAMTLGLPVVAADRGALPEVLGDAGLLVPATDAAAMAQAVGRVLDAPELAGAMAARGLERARAFSWESMAARTVEAYRAARSHRAESAGRS
jgi:glycosyltransferase involved in cell wall biosynthesis